MEAITAWIIYLGLQFLELCNGFPVTSQSDGGPPAMEWGALAPAVLAALFLLTMVSLLAGCACCQRDRFPRSAHPGSAYRPEVIEMPVPARVGQPQPVPVDTGIVNPIVDREFTIFVPLAVGASRPSPERIPEPHISPQQPYRPPDNGNNYPQFEDNNNGPISAQELENIVNNNAENYIVSEYENRNLNANQSAEERDDDILMMPGFSRNVLPPTAAPRRNIVEVSPADRLDQFNDWFDNPQGDFPRNQLQYLQEIGRGWFGRIVEGEAINLPQPLSAESSSTLDDSKPSVTKVAVKILDENVSVKEKCTFLNECRVYRDQRHENILSMLGRNLTQDPWLILFEFCPMGDLKQFLLSNKSKMSSLEEQGIPLKFQCEIASAVAYLHSRDIIHPDIACHSCMVADGLTARLGDYGDSERRHPNDYYRASDEKVIPLRWLPPESLTQKIAQEGNVWSLGIFLWESSSWGMLPYDSFTDEDVIANVMCVDGTKLPQPSPPTDYTVYMYHIMHGCWQYEPSARWTSHQVFSHLCNIYKTCYETTRGHTEDDPVMRNFNARWQNLKPNSIPKVDNGLPYSIPSSAEDLDYCDLKFPHSSGRSVASQDSIDKIDPVFKTDAIINGDSFRDKLKSDSLNNLHGSFESVRDPAIHEKVAVDLEDLPILNFQGPLDSLESSTFSDGAARERLFSSTSAGQPGKPVFAYKESSQVAPWLQDVALTSQEDMSYIKTVSDVISDLDNMLNSEKTSSSESSHQTSPSRDVREELIKSESSENDRSAKPALDAILISESVKDISQQVPESDAVEGQEGYPTLDFRLVKLQDKPDDCDTVHPMLQSKCPGNGQDYDSLQDSSYTPEASKENARVKEEGWGVRRQYSSGSETEDEIWKKRIEMGAITEKIKLKSKSVTDFMVLTHIDMDFTDLDSEDASYTSLDNKILYSLEKKYRKSQSDSPKKDSSLPTEEYLSFPRISSSSLLNSKPGLDLYKLKKSLWNMTLKNLRPTKSHNDLTQVQTKNVPSMKELLIFKSGMDSFLGKTKSLSLSDRPTVEVFDLSPGENNSQDCLRTPDSDTLINCPSIQTDNNSLDADRLFNEPSDASGKSRETNFFPEPNETLRSTEDAIDRILSFPPENKGTNFDSEKLSSESKGVDSLNSMPSEAETLQFSCNFTDVNAEIYSDKAPYHDDTGLSTYKSFADDAEDTTCYFNLPGDTMFSPFGGNKFSSMTSGNFVNFLTPLESLEKIKRDELRTDSLMAEEEHLKFSSNFTDINTNLNQKNDFNPENGTWEPTIYLEPPDGISKRFLDNERSHFDVGKNIESTSVESFDHIKENHTPLRDVTKAENPVPNIDIEEFQSPFALFNANGDDVTTSTPVLNDLQQVGDDKSKLDSDSLSHADISRIDDTKIEAIKPDQVLEVTEQIKHISDVFPDINKSIVDSVILRDESIEPIHESVTHFNQSDDSKVIESISETIRPISHNEATTKEKPVLEKSDESGILKNAIVDNEDASTITDKTFETTPQDVKNEMEASQNNTQSSDNFIVDNKNPETGNEYETIKPSDDLNKIVTQDILSTIHSTNDSGNTEIVLPSDVQTVDEGLNIINDLKGHEVSSSIEDVETKIYSAVTNESDDSRISKMMIKTIVPDVVDEVQRDVVLPGDFEMNLNDQFIINEAINTNVSGGAINVDIIATQNVPKGSPVAFDSGKDYQYIPDSVMSNLSDDSKIVTPVRAIVNIVDRDLTEEDHSIVNKSDDSRIIENLVKVPKSTVEDVPIASMDCKPSNMERIETHLLNHCDIEILPLEQQMREIKRNEINNLTSKLAMAENENNLNIEYSSPPTTNEENEIDEISSDEDMSSSHGHDSGLPTLINNNSSINCEATPLDDDLIESLDVEFMKLDLETENLATEVDKTNDYILPETVKTELKTGHSTGWFLHPKLEPLDGLENANLFNMPVKNVRVSELSNSVSVSNTGSTESLSENSTSERYLLDVDSMEALRNELELKLPLAQKIGQICHENVAEVIPQEILEQASVSGSSGDLVTDLDSTNDTSKSPTASDFMEENDIPSNVPPQAVKNELMIHYNLYGVVPLSPILEETWLDLNDTDRGSDKNVKYANVDVEDQEAAFNRLLMAYNHSLGAASDDLNISNISSPSYISSDVNSSNNSDAFGQAVTSFQWHQPVEMVMGCSDNPNISTLSDYSEAILSNNKKYSLSGDAAPQEFDSLEMETEIENVKDISKMVSMASETIILNQDESPVKEIYDITLADISGVSNNSKTSDNAVIIGNISNKQSTPMEILPADESKSNVKESTNNTVSDLTDDLSNISNISTPTFVSDMNTWNDSETYVKTTTEDHSESDNTLSVSDNAMQKTFIIEDKKCLPNDESMEFNHMVEDLPEDFVDASNNASPLPCENKTEILPETISDSQSSDATKKSFDIGSVVSHATQIPNSLYNVAVKLPDDTNTDTSNLSLPSMPTMNSLNESEACVTPMSAHNSPFFDEQPSIDKVQQSSNEENQNAPLEDETNIGTVNLLAVSKESNLSVDDKNIDSFSNKSTTHNEDKKLLTSLNASNSLKNPIIAVTHNFLASEISMAPFVDKKTNVKITDDISNTDFFIKPENVRNEDSKLSLKTQNSLSARMTSSPNVALDSTQVSFKLDISNISTDLKISPLTSIKPIGNHDDVLHKITANIEAVSSEIATPDASEQFSNSHIMDSDDVHQEVSDFQKDEAFVENASITGEKNDSTGSKLIVNSSDSDVRQSDLKTESKDNFTEKHEASMESILSYATTLSETIDSIVPAPYSPNSSSNLKLDILKNDINSFISNERSPVGISSNSFQINELPDALFSCTPDEELLSKRLLDNTSKSSREIGEAIDVLIDSQFQFLDCPESPIISDENARDKIVGSECSEGDSQGDDIKNSTDTHAPEISSPDLSQIYFSGPTNDDMMSTSFNESNSSNDDLAQSLQSLPNVHLKKLEDMNFLAPECIKEWESESDDSSSGEFVWKEGDREQPLTETSLSHFLPPSTPQKQVRQSTSLDFDTIPEEMASPSAESGGGSGDDEEVEFVPSSWDYLATPSKSALKSADTSQSDGRKRVVFKKQKYHCVYEYPREISDNEAESPQLPDYSPYSDWQDLNFDSLHGSHHDDRNFIYTIDNPVTDDDFFISSSTRPFENFSLLSTSSQFFPGQHLSLLDDQHQSTADNVDNFEALQNALGLNGPDPPADNTQSQLRPSDFITPDSGTEDVTPASLLDYEFKHQFLGEDPAHNASSSTVVYNPNGSVDGPDVKQPNVSTEQEITITSANKCGSLPVRQFCGTLILPERGSPSGSLTPSTPSPSASGQSSQSSGATSPLPPPSATLGGLRHTRDKLKLDLPPSPLARNSPNILTSGKNANKDIKIFDFRNVETPHLHELHKSLTETFSDPRKFTVTSVPEPFPNLVNPVVNKAVDILPLSNDPSDVVKGSNVAIDDSISREKHLAVATVTEAVSFIKDNVPTDEKNESKDSTIVLTEPIITHNIDTEKIESVDPKSNDSTQFEATTLQKAVVPLSIEENARKVILEPVKGEGTLLDSGDEDSGIGSSAYATLERKIDSKNPAPDLIKSSIIERHVN